MVGKKEESEILTTNSRSVDYSKPKMKSKQKMKWIAVFVLQNVVWILFEKRNKYTFFFKCFVNKQIKIGIIKSNKKYFFMKRKETNSNKKKQKCWKNFAIKWFICCSWCLIYVCRRVCMWVKQRESTIMYVSECEIKVYMHVW